MEQSRACFRISKKTWVQIEELHGKILALKKEQVRRIIELNNEKNFDSKYHDK